MTELRIYRPNDRARRNDNGRLVTIVTARPNGLRVFYVIEDVEDGHTAMIDGRDLRPVVTNGGTR
jgi:hypothetical protein